MRVGGLANVKWFVVHHTGSGAARPTTLETATFQIGPNAQDSFPGFAYWGEVEGDGTFCVAWDIETETWAQGWGSPSIDPNGEGINNEYGLAVEFSGQDPTDVQWATVVSVHTVAEIVAGHTLLFTGHRLVDPNTTVCPGDVAAVRLVSPY